nr:helix-turn-helix domain-containing protein [Desulforadius tongensis]
MVRVNDKPVRLTAAEFRLLLTLAENQGCYVSKDRLYALAVDDGAAVGNDTALKTHIKRIRQKLGDDGRNQKYIQCFKRYGYRLREDIDVKISSRD